LPADTGKLLVHPGRSHAESVCVFACAIDRRRTSLVWLSDAASARPGSRLRRRDLDSEGEYERPFFEQHPPPRLEAGAQVRRRRGEQEPRSNEGVLRVRSGSVAARILANKCDRADVGAPAAVLGAYA
jgi:hypothetical protein